MTTQKLLYLKYFQSFELYPKIQRFDSSRRALQKYIIQYIEVVYIMHRVRPGFLGVIF